MCGDFNQLMVRALALASLALAATAPSLSPGFPPLAPRPTRRCGVQICVVSCTAAAPSAPANAYRTMLSAVQAQYSCNAGYYGSQTTYSCSGTSWSGGGMPSCTQCPPGRYCAGGSQTSPLLCSAGYFGNLYGYTSAACGGQCAAGYYCQAGSTSSTQYQ